jgi:hypothetical protein
MDDLVLNKIAHYIDANTGQYLFSAPFADPDNIHHEFERYVGQTYTSYEQYLKEKNNED